MPYISTGEGKGELHFKLPPELSEKDCERLLVTVRNYTTVDKASVRITSTGWLKLMPSLDHLRGKKLASTLYKLDASIKQVIDKKVTASAKK